jgi:glycosyltransferase involved in cell wall biosynthesis
MKASILIIAHNHQQWLADAIDGALAQITDFDFEIIIGVDISDDRTLSNAQQYEKFHNNITVLHSSKNIGGKHNLARASDELLPRGICRAL